MLKELREKRGWSQEDVARLAECSVYTVGRLERGDTQPTLANARSLALVFNVPIETLFPKVNA